MKYRARYKKKHINPFHARFPLRGYVKIEVDLTSKQIKEKDKLARAATPEGYEFIECICIEGNG